LEKQVMKDLYAMIWRKTGRQQLVLIVFAVLVASLAALPIDFQKRIVNAIAEKSDMALVYRLGWQLALVFLAIQVLKHLFRYRIDILGEGFIRLLRNRNLDRQKADLELGRAPMEKGTLANVISAESEAVGNFVGRAFADPFLQVGTLVSVITYVAATQPMLGLVIVLISIPQAIMVVLVQPRINALVRQHVGRLRESINLITTREISANLRVLLENFDAMFGIRRRIFVWKGASKFFIGLTNSAGLIIVLVFGGYLVLQGKSDVGSVVAATIALDRVQKPWREMIAYFRKVNVVVVQYGLLREAI